MTTDEKRDDAGAPQRVAHMDWLRANLKACATTQVEDLIGGFVDAGGCDDLHPELGAVVAECVERGRALAESADAAVTMLGRLIGEEEVAKLRNGVLAAETVKRTGLAQATEQERLARLYTRVSDDLEGTT